MAESPPLRPGKYVGLISGTSMDGIDACLIDISDTDVQLLNCVALPYAPELRSELSRIATANEAIDLDTVGRLDVAVGERFAAAVEQVIGYHSPDDIVAIGSHGQTIRHRPEDATPFTLQIGDPNVIAARTGIDTVADFRRKDVALGGQGAPLAPLFHSWFLRNHPKPVGILNLGGIANLTLLSDDHATRGFDTGPANVLLDAWIRSNKDLQFDAAGHWAASGNVDEVLLQQLKRDPYFEARAPKSTGIEYFNLEWLRRNAANLDQLNPADVQATLAELTASSVVDALRTETEGQHLKRVLVCGGGARNLALMARLTSLAGELEILRTDDVQLPGDWVEAMTFAWLAACQIAGVASDLPLLTGASRPAVLGALSKAD